MNEQTKTRGGDVDIPPINPEKGSASSLAVSPAPKGGNPGSVEDPSPAKVPPSALQEP